MVETTVENIGTFIRPESLAQHGHIEGRLRHPGCAGDAVESAPQGRCRAGFDGDDKGQMAFLVAGALEEGIDIDLFSGESAGDLGDDAGRVLHHKADVMAQLELAAEGRRAAGQVDGARSVRESDEIGDDGDSGMSAAAFFRLLGVGAVRVVDPRAETAFERLNQLFFFLLPSAAPPPSSARA